MASKSKKIYLVLGVYVLLILMGAMRGKVGWWSQNWLDWLGLVLGAGVGWEMLWFDKIAYIYILHPEAQLSQYVKYFWKKRDWWKGLRILKQREVEMDKLTTRSFLFQVTWVALAIFSLTSLAGWFGKMLVMSLGLRILVEEWFEYFKNKQQLKKKLFWQIKREVSDLELKNYLWLMSGLFLGLNWIM